MTALVVGVGASSAAAADAAALLLAATLDAHGMPRTSVAAVATIDRLGTSPAVTAIGLPVRTFSAEALAAVPVPHPSDDVAAAAGTPSVAEAAALLAAGPGASLVVPKQRGEHVTLAVAVAVAGSASAPSGRGVEGRQP